MVCVLSDGEISINLKLRRLFASQEGLCCREMELYLGKKETDCNVKICCIISILFSPKCCFFNVILSFSVLSHDF
jgi:hypothetical protein